MSKTIFITGTSSGIGRATARLFAGRGWKVIATARNVAGSELSQLPGVTLLPLDVAEPAQIEAAARRALEAGPVDVVFNNAGFGVVGPLEGVSDEQLVAQIQTNLLGVIRVTKAFVSAFRERRSGVFIAMSSLSGLVPFPLNSSYCATKWAIEGWSESLAYELAPFGVQVKTVAAGDVQTNFEGSLRYGKHPAYEDLMAKMQRAVFNPARAASKSSPEQIAEVVWTAATDGSQQVTYVAGPDAKAMYGQRLALGVERFRKQLQKMIFG